MSDLVPPWEFKEALCAQVGMEVFFIEDRDEILDRSKQSDYEYARKVCNSCIHIKQCAAWAIKKERHGLWGGLTPQERKVIRKKLKITIEENIPFAS